MSANWVPHRSRWSLQNCFLWLMSKNIKIHSKSRGDHVLVIVLVTPCETSEQSMIWLLGSNRQDGSKLWTWFQGDIIVTALYLKIYSEDIQKLPWYLSTSSHPSWRKNFRKKNKQTWKCHLWTELLSEINLQLGYFKFPQTASILCKSKLPLQTADNTILRRPQSLCTNKKNEWVPSKMLTKIQSCCCCSPVSAAEGNVFP